MPFPISSRSDQASCNRYHRGATSLKTAFDLVTCAAAGGMGWGIRGQYGHETGAMIAGVLVGLTIVVRFCAKDESLRAMRAAAMFAIAIGIGGSMTYGQTIGLTQDPLLLGNNDAWRWGMLGLGIKGGIWIGLGSTFLGAGLGGVHYRWWEWIAIVGGMMIAYVIGVWVFNSPFEPSQKLLPAIYFSSDWRWVPDADWKPRPEVWGGYLLALLLLWITTGAIKKDSLAVRMGGWGFGGGFFGFSIGQSIQSYHAWNAEWMKQFSFTPLINWWNAMEIVFGAIMATWIAVGLILHRQRILPDRAPSPIALPVPLEWFLILLHLGLCLAAEFTEGIPWISQLYDDGLPLVVMPLACIGIGRYWPYAVLLPIVFVPIGAKTIRKWVVESGSGDEEWGWFFYCILPVAMLTLVTVYSARRATTEVAGRSSSRALLVTAWIYFGINFAFSRFPFPWQAWTTRTPSNLLFAAGAAILTIAALVPFASRSRLDFETSSDAMDLESERV